MSRREPAGRPSSRRQLLRAIAAGGIGALAGCSLFEDEDRAPTPSTPQPNVSRRPANGTRTRTVPDALRSEYGTAVNVVDAGGDHTGDRPIDDVLAAVVGDDTAIYFPRGEYRLAGTVEVPSFTNLALVGAGALVRPAPGYVGNLFDLGTGGESRGLRFEGLDFDFTAPNTGGRPIHGSAADDLLVRNVTVHGRQDVDHDSMRFDVTAENGTGHVEGVKLPHGGVAAYPITGIYVGEATAGTLTFSNCRVAGFPDNGLYASSARGTVRVLGGHYANNGISNVRVSSGAEVRDVRVTCDTNRRDLDNLRGIRLQEGTDIVVRNARIDMVNVPSSDGAITMSDELGQAVVTDTHIRTDADGVQAIRAKRPSAAGGQPLTGRPNRITLRNVHVTGDAAEDAAIEIEQRDNCLLANLCIQQWGADRDGIHFTDSRASRLQDVGIDVTGEPLVLENATLQRRNYRSGSRRGGC